MGFEDTLTAAVADGIMPHAVVSATNTDGSFTYSYAQGPSNLANPTTQVDTNTLFLMASQTKLLTTIACLQACERGLLSLDTDTTASLPELNAQKVLSGFDASDKPILKDRKTPLTLRHLLTHSSGLVYDAADPTLIKYQAQLGRPTNNGATVETRFDYPLLFEPGTSWAYGASIDWAGKLLERVAATTLEDWFHTHMFPQLGISKRDITFWPHKQGLGARVAGLTTRGADGKVVPGPETFINTGSEDCFGGHGGYGSTAQYLKVLQSLLANDGKLLKPETVAMMFTPQLSADVQQALQAYVFSPAGAFFIGEAVKGIEISWGLGGLLYLQDDVGRRRRGTLTWGGVCNTFWQVDPEAGLAMVFATQVLPPGDGPTEGFISAVELGLNEMVRK